MATEIREASAQDAGALAELNMMLHAMHIAWRPEAFRAASVEELEAHFRQWLGQENFRAYLALRDGRPVGYIVVRVVDRPGNVAMNRRLFLDVEQVGVAPDERGKGIGKALIERAKAFARERGLSRVELNVWAENAGARKAFVRWGFRTCSERMSSEA